MAERRPKGAIMKKIIVLCLVLFSSSANADSLFRFKDGSAHVWESYYAKGGQYCTMKSYGEYCVNRSDVVSIKDVPAGTSASEYSVSSLGDSEVDRDANLRALDSLNCEQLKASTAQKAQEQYRRECLSREQRQELEEEQARMEWTDREARAQDERARYEEEQRRKQKQAEQKVTPGRPRSNGY